MQILHRTCCNDTMIIINKIIQKRYAIFFLQKWPLPLKWPIAHMAYAELTSVTEWGKNMQHTWKIMNDYWSRQHLIYNDEWIDWQYRTFGRNNFLFWKSLLSLIQWIHFCPLKKTTHKCAISGNWSTSFEQIQRKQHKCI